MRDEGKRKLKEKREEGMDTDERNQKMKVR